MRIDLVVAGCIFNKNKLLLIHHRKLDKWLPVGGHIKDNETPDDALLREAEEEVNLDIKILGQSSIPLVSDTKRNLATPFYVNIHPIGDHNHCCLFYLCEVLNPKELRINKELKDARWFLREDLGKEYIPNDVRTIGLLAFNRYQKKK